MLPPFDEYLLSRLKYIHIWLGTNWKLLLIFNNEDFRKYLLTKSIEVSSRNVNEYDRIMLHGNNLNIPDDTMQLIHGTAVVLNIVAKRLNSSKQNAIVTINCGSDEFVYKISHDNNGINDIELALYDDVVHSFNWYLLPPYKDTRVISFNTYNKR